MVKIYFWLLLGAVGAINLSCSHTVSLLNDLSIPQAAYASSRVEDALSGNGYRIKDGSNKSDYLIEIRIDSSDLSDEAYSIICVGNRITITGGDARGMIYGCLSLSEDLMNGIALGKIEDRSERPHYPLRAIKFDTPWYSYRPSSALDQHYETVTDVNYWREFLDMMVENRFNSLSLFNLHPFTYMIMPKNFPEASPFTGEEMEKWKTLHKEIFRMATERAIETYIIPFNIFVSPEFSRAHNVALTNFYPHYYCEGDTSEIVKRYMRESITQVLQEYPDLTGIGLTLGEGMAGMVPQEREDWMFETYIEGMRLAGRETKTDSQNSFFKHYGIFRCNQCRSGKIDAEGNRKGIKSGFHKGSDLGRSEV